MIGRLNISLLKIQRTTATIAPAVSGLYIAGGIEPLSLILFGMATFFLHTSANALNDIADYDSDKINSPDRVLVLEILSIPQVRVVAMMLWVVGLLFALMVDWILFTVIASAGMILWLSYNFGVRLKDKPIGSLIYLSLSTSTVPFLGGFIVMRNLSLISMSFAFFLAIFTSSIIIDSLKDIRGDIVFNKKTIAVMLGEEKARKFVQSLILLPIMAYPVPWLIFDFSQIYLLYAIIPLSLRLFIGFILISRQKIEISRILTRILIVVDFTILALAKPEYGLALL